MQNVSTSERVVTFPVTDSTHDSAYDKLREAIDALPRHTPVEKYGHGIEMRQRDLGAWIRRRDVLAVIEKAESNAR